MNVRGIRVLVGALAVATMVAGEVAATSVGAGGAQAAPIADSFYRPPAQFGQTPGSSAPGTLIRATGSSATVVPLLGEVSDVGDIDARTTTVMYASTGAAGGIVPVTGTVLVPRRAWQGTGTRPVVVVGSGTVGAGDRCAPSRLLQRGQAYEEINIGPLLARGYAVAMTDYEGLGTPGEHPYLNRRSLGQSMLDMARVARNPRFGVDSDAPVAFWGYSEGGFAAGSAAELAASYAPELPVVGAYAGAPAPDLADLARLGDGSLLGAGVGWVVNGFIAAYPQHRTKFLAAFNPLGRGVLEEMKDRCVFDAPRMYPFVPTTFYTVDGRPIADHLRKAPWAKAVDDQRLGKVAPSMPVFVSQNRGDDVVAPAGTDRMVAGWRAGGADVTVKELPLPTILPKTFLGHAGGIVLNVDALGWLDRMTGNPA